MRRHEQRNDWPSYRASFEADRAGDPVRAAAGFRRVLLEQRDNLPPDARYAVLLALASNLQLRGLAKETMDAITQVQNMENSPAIADPTQPLFGVARGVADARTLSPDRAQRLFVHLTAPSERILKVSNDGALTWTKETLRADLSSFEPWMRVPIVGHMALATLHVKPLHNRIDALLEAFFEQPSDLHHDPAHHLITIAETWIRLAQLESAPPSERSAALERYTKAHGRLRLGSKHPSVRAHLLAAEARRFALEENKSRHEAAHFAAEKVAQEAYNPWVLFELCRTRSAHLVSRGLSPAADREGQRARRLAETHGWTGHLRTLSSTSSTTSASTIRSTGNLGGTASSVNSAGLQTSRSLKALLQVSLASATVTDPEEQARVVLDEIVRLLAADRALLFLVTAESNNEVQLAAGRTKASKPLPLDVPYSRKVVEEVLRTRQPVVFGDPSTQNISASDSIIRNDFRSIVAVPLMLGDRLLGLAYADSQLARGMFTQDDVEVFSAVANHVAIAIETSRATKLEAAIEAERAQRQLAERLDLVLSSLGSKVELSAVLQHILEHLTPLVPYKRASVLLAGSDGKTRMGAHRGFADDEISPIFETKPTPDIIDSAMFQMRDVLVLTTDFPQPHRAPSSGASALLVVPLVARDRVLGFLNVEVPAERGRDPHRAQVVSMFAAHAAIAVENARLFEEIRAQALTDSLTGVFTRRHFFALAERAAAQARREGKALGVLMIDVDHFKRVNDTFGHGVGDQVLIQTAQRIARALREVDILGRYGGEEFAATLVESDIETTRAMAERIRTALAGQSIKTEGGDLTVTASLGAAVDVGASIDLRKMMERADEALYRAKNEGRNRVCIAARADALLQ
ncbi:MAG: sensor domain-containing diguanylate cyclase [Deltaproteobacteria bacterium]|nr:sensor domain-containing diguanylate cyclase [Deltaproteobacteria bacterium]